MNLELKTKGTIFAIGFIAYLVIEVFFRAILPVFVGNFALIGFTSLWMGLLGGILLLTLGKYNEIHSIKKNLNLFQQSLCGSALITLLELIAGLILNVWLGFNIWTYSGLTYDPLAILTGGQISFTFMFAWFLISPLAFWLDDQLRWLFYRMGICHECNGHYSLLWLYSQMLTFKKVDYKTQTLEVEKKGKNLKRLKDLNYQKHIL